MQVEDVSATLDMALKVSGLRWRPPRAQSSRLLSDNGSGYISGDLAEWLQA